MLSQYCPDEIPIWGNDSDSDRQKRDDLAAVSGTLNEFVDTSQCRKWIKWDDEREAFAPDGSGDLSGSFGSCAGQRRQLGQSLSCSMVRSRSLLGYAERGSAWCSVWRRAR